MAEPIDTANDSIVGVQGENIIVMNLKNPMTKEKALRLAAWLIVLADDEDKFEELLEAVRNT